MQHDNNLATVCTIPPLNEPSCVLTRRLEHVRRYLGHHQRQREIAERNIAVLREVERELLARVGGRGGR